VQVKTRLSQADKPCARESSIRYAFFPTLGYARARGCC
jgi:hypothetical protein